MFAEGLLITELVHVALQIGLIPWPRALWARFSIDQAMLLV